MWKCHGEIRLDYQATLPCALWLEHAPKTWSLKQKETPKAQKAKIVIFSFEPRGMLIVDVNLSTFGNTTAFEIWLTVNRHGSGSRQIWATPLVCLSYTLKSHVSNLSPSIEICHWAGSSRHHPKQDLRRSVRATWRGLVIRFIDGEENVPFRSMADDSCWHRQNKSCFFLHTW